MPPVTGTRINARFNEDGAVVGILWRKIAHAKALWLIEGAQYAAKPLSDGEAELRTQPHFT